MSLIINSVRNPSFFHGADATCVEILQSIEKAGFPGAVVPGQEQRTRFRAVFSLCVQPPSYVHVQIRKLSEIPQCEVTDSQVGRRQFFFCPHFLLIRLLCQHCKVNQRNPGIPIPLRQSDKRVNHLSVNFLIDVR